MGRWKEQGLKVIVTSSEQLNVFPDASVAVYVTVVVPTGNESPEL